MTQVEINNEAISITLSARESLNIPSNEVWDVTMSAGIEDRDSGSGGRGELRLTVDGVTVLYLTIVNGDLRTERENIDMTIKGGVTVSHGRDDGGVHIGGFDIS
jgi:hypothetical protein